MNYAQAFSKLKKANLVQPLNPRPPPRNPPPSYNPNQHCEFNQGPGHDIENCTAFKHRIQDLVDGGRLPVGAPSDKFKNTQPSITNNPLPNHKPPASINTISTTNNQIDPTLLMVRNTPQMYEMPLSGNYVCVVYNHSTQQKVKLVPCKGLDVIFNRDSFSNVCATIGYDGAFCLIDDEEDALLLLSMAEKNVGSHLSTPSNFQCPIYLDDLSDDEDLHVAHLTRAGRHFKPSYLEDENPVEALRRKEKDRELVEVNKEEDDAIKRMKEVNANVSIWKLLTHSQPHRAAVLRHLNEVSIDASITPDQMAKPRRPPHETAAARFSISPMESSQSKRSASFSEQTSQPLSEKDMEELQSTLPPDKKLKAGREYIWNRKSKRKAEYWKYYLEYVENGKLRAECKFCPKTFAADGNLNGSKNVKNHAESCLGNPINIEKEKGKEKQTKLYFDQEHESGELKCGSRIINLNDVREALVHMIIVDELPFKHVEKPGFRHFVQVACPQFHIPSRVTIARDCLKLYYSEKEKLREMFKTCQRISVTTDTWTSIQRINYMCLTAHFIDNDWKLNKKIINFCPISSHKGEAIGKAVEACLEYWGIDDKIFTVTVDNASSNDVACAHNSPARILRFKDLVQKANIDSKSSLSFDVPTRWNSTYIMLETALKFRCVFSGLSLPDGEDLNDNEKPPEPEDWEKVERLVLFLEGFYLLTKRISGSHYVTANKGLGEIASMYDMLNNWEQSEDLNFQAMAIAMKKKFDKY
uniref:BED-type domain-containing protein n=1 Tax=Chenopodium quinoa TaxID=63459 RepID=A0A803MX30_CHEQI